ncbi:MAG: sulfatase [Verrucomicrobiota bacterium]
MTKYFTPFLVLILVISPLSAKEEARKNVLILSIDDLNDWVGCLGGHPQAATPNIDRLARRGVLFSNAHCQGPICGPSRASLFSGRYPHTTGVYQQPSGDDMYLDKRLFRKSMMPEYFAAHGYSTLAAGKLLHGYPHEKTFGEYRNTGGFGPKPPNGKRLHYHLPGGLYSGTQTDWGVFPEKEEEMPDHVAATWAEEKLGGKLEEPFFMGVGFYRPHVPFYVPEKWFEGFPLDEIELPAVRDNDLEGVPETGVRVHELPKYPDLEFLRKEDDQQFLLCVQAYLACIAFVDAQVGRVLDALDGSDYADNTVVVLFSDHGYHLGEKDRVSKHSLWEESTRVPLIFSGPGIPEGESTNKPVGLIDIYPTLLEVAGLPPKGSNEGWTLRGAWEDQGWEWRHSVLTNYGYGNDALRSETHRYIRYEDGTEELYDMENDPNAWNNLAGLPESKRLLVEFRRELPEFVAPYHPATSKKPINAWFEGHLKEHGVIEGGRKEEEKSL